MKIIYILSLMLLISCKPITNQEKVMKLFEKWHKEQIDNFKLLDSSNCNYEYYQNSEHPENAFSLVKREIYEGDINGDKKDDYIFCLMYDRCDSRGRGSHTYDEILLFTSEGDNYTLDDKFMSSILNDRFGDFDFNSIWDGNILGWIYSSEQNSEFENNKEQFAYIINYQNSSIEKADRNYWISQLNNVGKSEIKKFKIVSDKAYFYNLPKESEIKKSYLLNGDIFTGKESENGFIYATFILNGKKTIGWIKESEITEIR